MRQSGSHLMFLPCGFSRTKDDDEHEDESSISEFRLRSRRSSALACSLMLTSHGIFIQHHFAIVLANGLARPADAADIARSHPLVYEEQSAWRIRQPECS